MTLKRISIALFLLVASPLLQDVTSFSSPPASLVSLRARYYHHHHSNVANPFTTSSTTSTTTTLQAIPSWTYYSLAHVIGGTSGTPIVISGTKKGSWFDRIPKPAINPPNFVFGPVWTILYSLMGVSVSRIVKASSAPSSSSSAAAGVLKLWYGHYALNLLWAPIFFGLKRFRLGFIISSLLVVTLARILPLYHAIDPTAAYLQIPYLLWLTFATVLNYQFCVLNPANGIGVNEAMRQDELIKSGDGEEGYNDAMLKNDIDKLQRDAAKYAGL